ncbi:hypothetical protein KBY27_15840 [Ruegeria pomeroyi]|uniref:Lipopolysaccharide export system protein LptC n=1 Tax=Ruegeria pomeroyi TaxID=89184 RepID=A0A9Q3WMF7_9RHOB|nr:LPS export ABC transporter periplasmic protein LptC [Ruegeria pomeroyi]MCE8538925.1 hypothetical protein [Ruegeria pomeroyi]
MAVDSYSRVVHYLKVLLPLTALGLLSAVFLLSSRGTDNVSPIPFAEDEIADRTRGQQVTGPFFSAVTPKGEQIQVQATLARPGGDNVPAEATDLVAELLLLGGRRIRLTSDMGTVQMDKDLAIFTGNVVITTSDGLTVTTEQLNAGLSGISGETPGSVRGTGPIGEFTAGSMQMGAENEGGPVHIRFKNGVKLLYDPKAAER